MHRPVILICLLFLAGAGVCAQDNRLEIEVGSTNETPYVETAGEDGFFLIIDRSKDDSGNRVVSVAFYDREMLSAWQKEINYTQRLPLNQRDVFENKLYLLFQSSREGMIEIVELSKDGNMVRMPIPHLRGLEVRDMHIFYDQCYITGMAGNTAVAFRIDMGNRTIHPLPLTFRGTDVEIGLMAMSKSSLFISIGYKYRRNRVQVLRELDPFDGNTINDIVLKPDGNYDLVSAQATVLNAQETLVIGTWGFPGSEFTQGFYISKFNGGMELYRNYYSFTDLGNFFSFLDPGTSEKFVKRAERKKSKGRDLKLQYRLLTHEIIQRGDDFVMLGEAYYPVYRTQRVYNYYRGIRGYDYIQVFDGFRYTHAVVAGFNSVGKLQWDQSFQIDETRVWTLEERISICSDCDNISIAYNNESEIHIAQINGGSLNEVTDSKIPTGDTGDRIRQASLGDSDHWYGPYFLFWGYQRIVNRTDGDKNRRIFYINKVRS